MNVFSWVILSLAKLSELIVIEESMYVVFNETKDLPLSKPLDDDNDLMANKTHQMTKKNKHNLKI